MRWLALAICELVWPVMGLAECRQALALGLDVSGSVDAREYRLQVDGVANALRDDPVRAAFLAIPDAPVRLMIYEWSELAGQRVLVPWTEIASEQTLFDLAEKLERVSPAPEREGSTALSAAIVFGARALATQACWRKVLDISGDGPGNRGAHPRDLTDPALEGTIVNGLVVGPMGRANTTKDLSSVKTLEDYFESFVIRGADAFIETAKNDQDFASAMQRKLIRELQPPGLARATFLPAQ